MNIKILITYKDYHKLLKSDILQPIQTGRAISSETFPDMIGDDTGDNISKYNNKYSELSAQYWAWKHYAELGNPDYIGHMQYRRHFIFNKDAKFTIKTPIEQERGFSVKFVQSIDENYVKNIGLDDKTIKANVKDADIIAVNKANMHYINCVNAKDDFLKHVPGAQENDYVLLMDEVLRKHPSYASVIKEFEENPFRYFYHMYIMKKDLFFEYNEFVFPVLFKLDKRLDYSRRGLRGGRVLGYLGEFLLSLFLIKKEQEGKKIKEVFASCVLENKATSHKKNIIFSQKKAFAYSINNNSFYKVLSSILSLDDNITENTKIITVLFYKDLTQTQFDYFSNLPLRKLKIELHDLNLLEKDIPSKFLQCDFLKMYYFFSNLNTFIYVDSQCIFNRPFSIEDFTSGTIWASKHPSISHIINHNFQFKAHIKNILGLDNPYHYFSDKFIICNYSDFLKNKVHNLLDNKFFTIKTQSDILNYLFKDVSTFFKDDFLMEAGDVERKKYFSYEEYTTNLKQATILYCVGEGSANNDLYKNEFWKHIRNTPFYESLIFNILQNKENTRSSLLLRNELARIHFPNINRHFAKNERELKLLFVMDHMFSFRLKRFYYRVKKAFSFGKRYEKYNTKYNTIMALIKDAKERKKELFRV